MLTPTMYAVAVGLVTIVSIARIARLFTFDKFPPTAWLREKYVQVVGPDWGELLFCGYCFGVWASAFVVGTGYFAGVYTREYHDGWTLAWWMLNGILAAAYLGAIVMKRDGDDA